MNNTFSTNHLIVLCVIVSWIVLTIILVILYTFCSENRRQRIRELEVTQEPIRVSEHPKPFLVVHMPDGSLSVASPC